MEHVFLHHGWPVASDYHSRVMERWKCGFLDPEDVIDTAVFRRGDVEGALHMLSYTLALKGLKTGGSADTDASGYTKKGSKTKLLDSDTYCARHKQWYRTEDNHSWDATKKTGSCLVATAEAKK